MFLDCVSASVSRALVARQVGGTAASSGRVLPHDLGGQAYTPFCAVERKRGYRRDLARTAAQQRESEQESSSFTVCSSFDESYDGKAVVCRMKNHGTRSQASS